MLGMEPMEEVYWTSQGICYHELIIEWWFWPVFMVNLLKNHQGSTSRYAKHFGRLPSVDWHVFRINAEYNGRIIMIQYLSGDLDNRLCVHGPNR